MTVRVIVHTGEIDRIARKLETSVQKVCEDLAEEARDRAQQFAPVDTGALKASIHVKTRNRDDFQQAANIASQRRPEAFLSPLPELDKDVYAIMGSGIHYAAYVELGTSRMGARPYITPAVQSIYFKWGLPTTWKEVVE